MTRRLSKVVRIWKRCLIVYLLVYLLALYFTMSSSLQIYCILVDVRTVNQIDNLQVQASAVKIEYKMQEIPYCK